MPIRKLVEPAPVGGQIAKKLNHIQNPSKTAGLLHQWFQLALSKRCSGFAMKLPPALIRVAQYIAQAACEPDAVTTKL